MTEWMGKVLMLSGIFLFITGFLFALGSKFPFLGKLPGDILIKRDNFTFYFPLATSILISVVLTILLNLIFRK